MVYLDISKREAESFRRREGPAGQLAELRKQRAVCTGAEPHHRTGERRNLL